MYDLWYNKAVDIIALDNVILPSLNGRKRGFSMYVPNHVFHPMTMVEIKNFTQ